MTPLAALALLAAASAPTLKPYVLGNAPPGDAAAALQSVEDGLTKAGFQVLGTYSPYDGATVVAFTSPDLEAAAAKGTHGGFGAVERASVTVVGGQNEVAWTNPLYFAAAYRLPGDLASVRTALEGALGSKGDFGSKNGLTADKLRKYQYMMGMESFDSDSTNLLKEFKSHQEAIDAVEAGLAAGRGGTKKIYRLDVPGTEQTVFGVALGEGDGADDHVMKVIDFGDPHATPYLPYEILVDGTKAYHLFMRFRTAVHFPDLGMGTFMKIMSSPKAVKKSLTAVVTPPPARKN
jgi:hypothetical protein